MSIIAGTANLIRRMVENKEEREDPSGGFLPYRVRVKATSLIKESGRLMDIGCGEGLLLKRVPYPNKELYGLDSWPVVLEKARERVSASFSLGDAALLPFQDESFDEVTILNLLYNLPDINGMINILKEGWRVCKKGGRVIFDYRNRENPLIWFGYKTVRIHDPKISIPVNAYRRQEIKRLLASLGASKVKYYSIPPWWLVNSPAYLVEVYKT